MADRYGTPRDMYVNDFVKREFFAPAMEAVVAKKEADARAKAAAEARRREHRWKLPGGKRKG